MYGKLNVKKSILAVMAAGTLLTGSAFATTLTLNSANVAYFGDTFTASTVAFTDEFTFVVPDGSLGKPAVNYTVGAFYVPSTDDFMQNVSISKLTFFKVDGATNDPLSTSYKSSGYFTTTGKLASGTYGFDIVGTTIGGKGGSYSGTLGLTLTPVPEPETYSMFVVGLGLLGFAARRKSNPKLG